MDADRRKLVKDGIFYAVSVHDKLGYLQGYLRYDSYLKNRSELTINDVSKDETPIFITSDIVEAESLRRDAMYVLQRKCELRRFTDEG